MPVSERRGREVTPKELPLDAAVLLAAIRAKGSDATTLRDAAHEACHALQWGVKKRWTRGNIHARKPKRNRLFGDCGIRDEITARVEQLVCAHFGVDCGTVEKWAMVCWMETLKNEGIRLPPGNWLVEHIKEAMAGSSARRLADQILAICPRDGGVK
jgi:hypothetical protein